LQFWHSGDSIRTILFYLTWFTVIVGVLGLILRLRRDFMRPVIRWELPGVLPV